MDKQITAAVGLIDESFKGNLHIRLHQLQRIDGSFTCVVDVSAWNAWAGQAKVLFAQGGIELEDARDFFAYLTKWLRGYDWHEDQYLWERT